MSDFGAGPYLTRDLDFQVTTTGDLRVSRGVDELEKDIALQSLIKLDGIQGRRQTPKTRSVIKSRLKTVFNQEPRIERIIDIRVRFLQDLDTVQIAAQVVADNTEQELVFTI